MLQVDRVNLIRQMLQKQESVVVSDLSSMFSVSNETIRRDLDKLCAMDSCIMRAHGGAYMSIPNTDPPYRLRRVSFIEAKQRMAASCLSLIHNGDCLMIDCSTTTLQLVKLLCESHSRYTVITNSFGVVQEVVGCDNITLVCIGGQFDQVSCAFVGNTAQEALSSYHADKAIISCSGVSTEFGITDNSEAQATVRSLMLQNSGQHLLLADSSKFGKCKTNSISQFDGIDAIYTDTDPGVAWREVLSEHGVDLHVCQ